MRVDIPAGLAEQARLGPDWVTWLQRLPARTRDLLDEWSLSRDDDETWHGYTSLVLPVRTGEGAPAVLKVTFDGDEESLHEGLALQRWGGRGAVRLLRADPARRSLLLERLQREDLTGLWDVEACEVVARLYGALHVPAPPQLRPLTEYVERSAAGFADLPRDSPLPRRLVEQAVALDRDLVTDPASTGVMIHGDLHYENVLAGDREPWLVIDPKPMSGDPHYEVAPLLWNRWDEVLASGSVRDAVRHRFHTVVDTAGLDEDRARAWVVVRQMHNALWSVEDAVREDRLLDVADREWVTRCITIAKAVQD